jgi:hypothetical protein
MNHPYTLQQLALDRQRERLEEADTYRLIKQLSRSRREARAERCLYRVARRAFGMTARHALPPVREPSLGSMKPQPPRTAPQPSRIDDLEADICDAELVSAGPSSRHLEFTKTKESHL